VLNNLGEAARRLGELALIAGLLFNVVDHGTRRHRLEWKNVARDQGCPLSAVDELASVSALRRCPLLIDLLVLVRAVELNSNERRAPSRIVDQLAHHTADVTVPLSVVERTECARTLAVLGVRGEDGPATLTLPADLTTLQSTKKEMLGSAEKVRAIC